MSWTYTKPLLRFQKVRLNLNFAVKITSTPGAPKKSWTMNYTVLSFMMNGQLYSEYKRISNMVGLPCSDSQWSRIIEWLEKHVTSLAERSCKQVRDVVRRRGDEKTWVSPVDTIPTTLLPHYMTMRAVRLHGLHIVQSADDTTTGREHHVELKQTCLIKSSGKWWRRDSTSLRWSQTSMNSIYCRYFPEGTITYCSNHCAKTLHKDLQHIKQNKCKVTFTSIK